MGQSDFEGGLALWVSLTLRVVWLWGTFPFSLGIARPLQGRMYNYAAGNCWYGLGNVFKVYLLSRIALIEIFIGKLPQWLHYIIINAWRCLIWHFIGNFIKISDWRKPIISQPLEVGTIKFKRITSTLWPEWSTLNAGTPQLLMGRQAEGEYKSLLLEDKIFQIKIHRNKSVRNEERY